MASSAIQTLEHQKSKDKAERVHNGKQVNLAHLAFHWQLSSVHVNQIKQVSTSFTIPCGELSQTLPLENWKHCVVLNVTATRLVFHWQLLASNLPLEKYCYG